MMIFWGRVIAVLFLALSPAAAKTKEIEEPPKELLEDLEFFQNLDMIENSEFLNGAEEVVPWDVKKSTDNDQPKQEETQ